jgi:hypothetical protein
LEVAVAIFKSTLVNKPFPPLHNIVASGVVSENLPAREASNDNGMSREKGYYPMI